MPISTKNGFSEDELNQYQGWSLPDVSNGGEISASVKKTKKKQQDNSQEATSKETSVELIEDIDTEIQSNPSPSINAEQLQEITDAAEKEGFESGEKQGFKKGKEEGIAKGLEEGKQRIQEQSLRLERLIDVLMHPLDNERKEIEGLIINMVCRLTETLVERELKTDSTQIVTLVDQVLSLIPQSISSYTLHLNPNDIALVESHLQDSSIELPKEDKTSLIKKDASLLPGGCRLESSQFSVDATVETKIKTLLDDFIQQRTVEPVAETERQKIQSSKTEKDHFNSQNDSNTNGDESDKL